MNAKTDWPRWMSKQTAAMYADVTLPTLEKWIRLGLPLIKTPSGSIRIDREQFDAWIARSQQETEELAAS